MPSFRLAVAALFVSAGLLFPQSAAAAIDYFDAGPYAFTTTSFDAGFAGTIGGSLVVPDGAGPFPLLVASHGWSASSAQQLGWAEHYATWGFVVAVPSFPNSLTPNAQVDEGIIVQLVQIYSDAGTVSPAQGLVDPTHVGLEGHSAGGLATTLAAAELNPGAVVLFDPVDANDAGAPVYATLCPPVLDIFADPSACNNQEEWSTFATRTSAPLVQFHVVGASHCDGENVDRGAVCGLACGGNPSAVHEAVFGRYATAFFLWHLKGDTGAQAIFELSALEADGTIADASVSPAAASCAGGDAGPLPSDAGGGSLGRDASVDATSRPLDAGMDAPSSAWDGGTPPGGPPPPTPADGGASPSKGSSGSGCAIGVAPGPGGVGGMIFLGALALSRRRRLPGSRAR